MEFYDKLMNLFREQEEIAEREAEEAIEAEAQEFLNAFEKRCEEAVYKGARRFCEEITRSRLSDSARYRLLEHLRDSIQSKYGKHFFVFLGKDRRYIHVTF